MKITQKICLFLLIIHQSCNLFKKETHNLIPLCKVYDKILYYKDIKEQMVEITKKDSMFFVKKIINNWIDKQLVLNKAEQNIEDEKTLKKIEIRTREYREELLIYEYQKHFVAQRLDTIVSKNKIEDYYNKNKSSFILQEHLVKTIYAKVNKKYPNMKKVKMWMYSDNNTNVLKLQEYCIQYSIEYNINDDEWISLSSLYSENKDYYNKIKKLKGYLEIEGEEYIYFFNIKNHKFKKEISPLEMEIAKIKGVIINKRKKQLISKKEKDLYKYTKDRGNIKIYLPKENIK